MSLSSLPTELVRQIIETSVPSTFHSTTYKERQSTLRSLCLVSKRFRHIAQPLLLEIIWRSSPESLDAALEAFPRKPSGKFPRHVLITSDRAYLPNRFDKLMQYPVAMYTLVLHIKGPGTFDLGSLQSLPDLASLQLTGRGYKLSSPFDLVKVHTLTLGVEVLEIVSSSLNPDHLPSLRNLALLNVYLYEDALELQTNRFFGLLPQLTSFYSDWELAKTSPELWRDDLDRILFHSYGFDLFDFTTLQLAVQNLQVYKLFGDRDDDSITLQVRQFIDWIKSATAPSLCSIYLDAELQGPVSLQDKEMGLMRELQTECEDRNIDIVFEKQAKDANVDSSISAEFCRRQEALKIDKRGTT